MTRAVRASGPQVMGNAFQMRLGLLGLIPKSCFQTVQASGIFKQRGTSAVRIPVPFDSASVPGPDLRGFWSPRWGMGQLIVGQQRVGLGSQDPLTKHPVCGRLPLAPSSCFPRFSSCYPNLASLRICQGCPTSGWMSSVFQLTLDGRYSFSFLCHPPWIYSPPGCAPLSPKHRFLKPSLQLRGRHLFSS